MGMGTTTYMMTTRNIIADGMVSTVISTTRITDCFSSLTVSVEGEEPVYVQQDLYIHNNIIYISTTFNDMSITLVLTKILCIHVCAVILLTEGFHLFKPW